MNGSDWLRCFHLTRCEITSRLWYTVGGLGGRTTFAVDAFERVAPDWHRRQSDNRAARLRPRSAKRAAVFERPRQCSPHWLHSTASSSGFSWINTGWLRGIHILIRYFNANFNRKPRRWVAARIMDGRHVNMPMSLERLWHSRFERNLELKGLLTSFGTSPGDHRAIAF